MLRAELDVADLHKATNGQTVFKVGKIRELI